MSRVEHTRLRRSTDWVCLDHGDSQPVSAPNNKPWFGAFDNRARPEGTGYDAFDQIMADSVGVSRPVSTFMHGYSGSNLPISFASSAVSSAQSLGIGAMLNTKRPWPELANGDYDADIASLFNSWPTNVFGSVTINHEPENDGPSPADPSNPNYLSWAQTNGPLWSAGVNRFINVAAPIIRGRGLDVKVGGCLMGFSWDTTRWQYWNWWDSINPANLDAIEFQIDEYAKTVNGNPPYGYDLMPRIDVMLNVARSVGIQHFSLFETAVDRRLRNGGETIVGDDSTLAAWWPTYASQLSARPEVRMVGYFHTPTGPASAQGYLEGPAVSVYANICLNGRRFS